MKRQSYRGTKYANNRRRLTIFNGIMDPLSVPVPVTPPRIRSSWLSPMRMHERTMGMPRSPATPLLGPTLKRTRFAPSPAFVPRNEFKRNYGNPIGFAESNRLQTYTTYNITGSSSLFNGPNLNSWLVNGVVQSGEPGAVELGEDDLTTRQRQIINCLGIEYRYSCVNMQDVTHLTCHIAFVSPKRVPDLTDDRMVLPTTGFFRGDSNSRAQNFDNVTCDASVLNYNPINTDRYTVLSHEKFILAPQTGTMTTLGQVSGSGSNTRVDRKYVKVNRQIRFNGRKDTDIEDPIFIVFWFVPVGYCAGTYAAGSIASFRVETIMHWREPCKTKKIKK